MSTRLSKMKELATIEAKKLKKYATPEEINNLDKKLLNPCSSYRCIYGLMTGNCEEERALQLIKKCTQRVYHTTKAGVQGMENYKLNGKPYNVNNAGLGRSGFYISPIEMVILHENGGEESSDKIIDYLQGETKTLKL